MTIGYYEANGGLTIPSLDELVSDLLSLVPVACPCCGCKRAIRQEMCVDCDDMIRIDGRIVIAYIEMRAFSNRCFEVKAPMLRGHVFYQTL